MSGDDQEVDRECKLYEREHAMTVAAADMARREDALAVREQQLARVNDISNVNIESNCIWQRGLRADQAKALRALKSLRCMVAAIEALDSAVALPECVAKGLMAEVKIAEAILAEARE